MTSSLNFLFLLLLLLPGYPAWRKQCGLEKIRHFDDLDRAIPKNIVNILKQHYESVYDIDLYVAGILEYHLENSELGPLFSCMIAEQFRRLKYGDRFYYENSGQLNSFTAGKSYTFGHDGELYTIVYRIDQIAND